MTTLQKSAIAINKISELKTAINNGSQLFWSSPFSECKKIKNVFIETFDKKFIKCEFESGETLGIKLTSIFYI